MRRVLLLCLVTALGLRAPAAPAQAGAVGPLSQQVFVGALTQDLVSHFNLEGELQLELLRAWTPPSIVAADWQVIVSDYPSVVSSAMLLRCRVVADGAVVADGPLTLRANLWREAWVARQPVSFNSTFDPAVNAGRILTWRDVARRPLVKKGDVVEISASDGNLSVTMKALALQSGAQGDAVTFRNLESRKDFTAFVVDENRAQVRF